MLSSKDEKKLVIADNIAAVLSLPIVWIELDTFNIEKASTLDYDVNGVDYVHLASMEADSIIEVLSADKELDRLTLSRINAGRFFPESAPSVLLHPRKVHGHCQ